MRGMACVLFSLLRGEDIGGELLFAGRPDVIYHSLADLAPYSICSAVLRHCSSHHIERIFTP